MGLLDDIMASDAAFFVDADGFGEEVTVILPDASTRTINAIVHRGEQSQAREVAGRGSLVNLWFEVRNDSTHGISASEYRRGYKIRVTLRRGEAETADVSIFPKADDEQEWHDAGMCYFRTVNTGNL